MDTTPIVVGILSDALSVPVSTEMPPDRPSQYVLVDLAGDQSTPFVLRPRYALTCWGTSDMDAKGIALSAVQALQEAAEDHDLFSSAQLETMSREEWSRDGQSRYVAMVDIVINTE